MKTYTPISKVLMAQIAKQKKSLSKNEEALLLKTINS